MGYKVQMKDGSTVTIDDAVTQKRDGSGLYLYNKDGDQVASFPDGTFGACFPSGAKVEAAPPAIDAAPEATAKKSATKKG